MAPQQPLFSEQHFRPFSQQPSLASATQQADFSAQQARFLVQQLSELLAALTCGVVTNFAVQQSTALDTVAFTGPQQAFASLQQAKPSVQHF